MKFKKAALIGGTLLLLTIAGERACHYADNYIRKKAAEGILEMDIYGGKHHKQKLSLNYPK